MERKIRIVSVKFSDSELEQIDKMAFKTCRMRSTYIREVVLGYAPQERPSEDFNEVIRQLRYLNNNLNQLTVKAHSFGFIDDRKYANQVNEINSLIIGMKRKYLLGEKRNGTVHRRSPRRPGRAHQR